MALDIALAGLPIIADHTIVPIKAHVCYALYCKTNLQNLAEKLRNLKNAWNGLQLSADEERRNGKTIHQHVTQWLNEVDALIKEAESQSSEDENRRKKRCFIGLCPDFSTLYKLGKNAKKNLATVTAKIEEKAKLGPVAYHAAPMGMDHVVSVKGYEAMASRNKIFDDIMTALRVGGMKMIGVYGMGGIGKTTLVKVVAREAVHQKLFDKMVIATVTLNPDIMKIQQEIGDQLGITFKDKGECGRAIQLRDFLKQEKILIVLDDLWNGFDLDAVGISFQDEQKDCKMLLTSRKLDVLSTGMDVHHNFSVEVLENVEAWDLFEKTAGSNVANPEVRPTAMKIATKCGGLPVAIVTIAKALKDRSWSEWKDAWCQLQRPSPGNFTGVPREVYTAIELSYQHLGRDELKSTFLFCSRMGYNASVDDLLKYGMGLGLFSYVATTEEARNRVFSLVRELKNSCLLLDGNTNNQFSIHDVVRDVAISIAFRDHAVFVKSNDVVELGGLGQDSQREYREIWLHGESVRNFKDLNCKNLEIFIMKSKHASMEIPGEVFEGMEKLKVLGLTNISFSSMPSSLHLLKHLHSLCIHQSLLGEIAVIGQLKQLEILSFVESSIMHLPREIGELTKLKLLDLTDCSELQVISPNVISRLTLLQELHMGNSFHHWDAGENNVRLIELIHLSSLIDLDIHIPDASIISEDHLFSDNLERYKIFIGDVWDWHDLYETSRILKLKFRESTDHLKPGISILLRRAEDLYLLELKGVRNVICELNSEGFPNLKHLHLQNSFDIRYVIDTMEMDGIVSNDCFFPMLESLFLHNLASLNKIVHGRFGAQSFEKLQILEVEDCVELENLFCFSREQDVNDQIAVVGFESSNVMEFSQLRSICLKKLPNLNSFSSTNKASGSIETQSKSTKTTVMEAGDIILEEEMLIPVPVLFDEKIMFPMLEDLQLVSIGKIERLWCGQLSVAVSTQNLQRLELRECFSLRYIFSLSMVKSLVQLKRLSVINCISVEEIIETRALEEEETKILFPKLEDIELVHLRKLRRFCTGSLIECPLLKALTVQTCYILETFISDYESRKVTVNDADSGEVKLELKNHRSAKLPLFNKKVVFPSLSRIKIRGMYYLEKIWNNQFELASGGSFCELTSMEIGSCRELVNVFPLILLRRFQRLEQLYIEQCESLEEVFEVGGGGLSSSTSFSVSSFQLRDLSLKGLPKLKHIWNQQDPQGILNFHNLHTLYVFGCGGLKNLFPFSMVKDGLLQLEKLEIGNCTGLEQMVAEAQGDGEATFRFEFPQLTSFTLENLPEFRNLYPMKNSWECPKLRRFQVINCPNVKVFDVSKSQNIKGVGDQHDDDPIQQPLFLVEKVIRSLEELSLDGRKTSATSILWHPHLLVAQDSYSKLKVLNLQYFGGKADPIPFGFLQRLGNLETLSIKYSSFTKLFLHEGYVDHEEEPIQMLARLGNLELDGVNDLWEQDHRFARPFHNLWSLKVDSCSSLVINFMALSISSTLLFYFSSSTVA